MGLGITNQTRINTSRKTDIVSCAEKHPGGFRLHLESIFQKITPCTALRDMLLKMRIAQWHCRKNFSFFIRYRVCSNVISSASISKLSSLITVLFFLRAPDTMNKFYILIFIGQKKKAETASQVELARRHIQ